MSTIFLFFFVFSSLLSFIEENKIDILGLNVVYGRLPFLLAVGHIFMSTGYKSVP